MFIIFSDKVFEMNICVEAGIGLGKTTLLRNLKRLISCDYEEDIMIVTEPVKLWREVSGKDLLQLFAEDPKKFSFPTQVHILSTMSYQRERIPSAHIRIFERSIDASEFIFKPVLVEDGFLTDLESKILSDLHLSLSSRAPKMDGIIYLKGTADLALKRIKNRNFGCDEDLPLSYLEKLQRKHDEYIEKMKGSGIDVLTIDAGQDEATVADEATNFVMKKFGDVSKG